MRKWAFILSTAILYFVLPEDASAQRYLPGMRGLQFTTGTTKNGYHSGIAFSWYTKRADRWMFGAEYIEKRYPYKNIKIPQSIFMIDAGYYLKLLSDQSKTFFLSIGASGVAGYETINWNDKILYDGATIINSDNFIYGGAFSLEMEIYLTDRTVFLANTRERLLLGSSVGKFHTQFGLGIKFIIN